MIFRTVPVIAFHYTQFKRSLFHTFLNGNCLTIQRRFDKLKQKVSNGPFSYLISPLIHLSITDMNPTKKLIIFCTILSALISLQSCGAKLSPVEQLASLLNNFPEYTIILEDMQTGGSFFKQYYHKYKTII